MTSESNALFSVLRQKREFLPDGFRDEDGVWHDGPHREEFDAMVNELSSIVTGLTSYALAGPSNEASRKNRDDLVYRAKLALGINE